MRNDEKYFLLGTDQLPPADTIHDTPLLYDHEPVFIAEVFRTASVSGRLRGKLKLKCSFSLNITDWVQS